MLMNLFIEMIRTQTEKEKINDIWKNSPFRDLVKLQSNNVGNVGERFLQSYCDTNEIGATINGCKTKGENIGDGLIMGKSVEIKTSHQGCKGFSFQHELGEYPWKSDFMIFIDVSPDCIYLTLFKNFTEDFYKSHQKCDSYFPTKKITWRKGSGAFKLDTSIKINEENIIRGHAIKITDTTTDELKVFLISKLTPQYGINLGTP